MLQYDRESGLRLAVDFNRLLGWARCGEILTLATEEGGNAA
ncbi:hypothetical protein [Chamaesiphon sp.]